MILSAQEPRNPNQHIRKQLGNADAEPTGQGRAGWPGIGVFKNLTESASASRTQTLSFQCLLNYSSALLQEFQQ